MALTPKLELRQSQTLVMTPQLLQAIKLLQLSNIELTAYVERELERNPLLEQSDGDQPAPEAPDAVSWEADAAREAGAARDADGSTALKISEDRPTNTAAEASLDADYASVYSEDSAADAATDYKGGDGFANGGLSGQYAGKGGSIGFDNPNYNIENSLSDAETLQQYLLAQLTIAVEDPVDRIIGAYLIDSVDEAGYLKESVGAVADRLGCDPDRVSAVLFELQKFDPVGVFARDLGECLSLQLRERDRFDPAMQALIENLNLLADRDLAAMMRVCGVDAADVADMIAEIKTLNPKPGLAYGAETVQTLVPDVFVRPDSEGGWLIELNSDTLPKVLVNDRYHAKVSSQARNKDVRTYLSECLNSANWLVKSLNQRANTILRVATEIVRQQDGFFAHGVQYLRPLNLRAIAEANDMHESTVSRVTTNKFMATPRGIFELKYFFTSSIASSEGGEAHSAESVRHRIKKLIERENPNSVLSDDKIVDILRGDDIDIARRTVAKYREALRIPSSVQRRRQKKMLA